MRVKACAFCTTAIVAMLGTVACGSDSGAETDNTTPDAGTTDGSDSPDVDAETSDTTEASAEAEAGLPDPPPPASTD